MFNSRWKRTFAVLTGSSFVSLIYMFYITSTVSERQLTPCKIDVLNPWDAVLKPFLVPPEEMECKEKSQLMFVNDSGWLHINKTLTTIHRIDISILQCTYQILTRVDGDMELEHGRTVTLQTPEFITSHVFRVTCSNTSAMVYDMVHFNAFWNENAKLDSDISDEARRKLSVIIIGIDSVSRSHAVRNLPNSYKYMKQEFDMYDFKGYGKVGENTWPNLVPLLTGQSHRHFPLVEHIHLHADSMPLLWNEKAVKHMASFFAEDRPDISTFNYVKSGFKKFPTDYYFRPYTLAMHEFEPFFLKPLGKPTWDCYGHRNYFDLQIEYLKGFLTRYKDKRKLAYFWSNQAGHEDFTTLGRFDNPLLDFLQWIKRTNTTNNAILIILSDHGFRIGGASLTHIGRAENNKPWLMVHVPKHLLTAKIHQTLVQNTKRLVSHFDTYQTILDIINQAPFQNTKPAVPVRNKVTRRNLFTEIPSTRTCVDAGIEEKYCTCREKTNVSPISPLAQALAIRLVSSINRIIANVTKQCHMLQVKDVTEVSVVYSNSDELNLPKKQQEQEKTFWLVEQFRSSGSSDTQTGRYTVLFHTSPGNGYFEGTMDYSMFAEPDTDKYTLIGEPSRLDRYGNQSHCVEDSFLKLYCYCTQQV